ncbi:MAG TPA: hypothetical protein VFG83_18720 [Kofleriaceae bacterium]|nr:hypothetical protein [Kofleriaceae bacterium]
MQVIGALLATAFAVATASCVVAVYRRRRPQDVAFAALAAVCVVIFVLGLVLAIRPAQARPVAQKLGHVPSAWPTSAAKKRQVMTFADGYRDVLSAHKTEREVAAWALASAAKSGFQDLFKSQKISPGDKLFASAHGSLVALVIIGTRPLGEGAQVIVAGIDTARIDLKPQPIYADADLALLQTHYYGHIKPYQWLSIPLELRGVVALGSGRVIKVGIGDDPGEPVLVIPDLGPGVSAAVDGREGESIPAEKLDPIVGSIPGPTKRSGDRFAQAATRAIERGLGIRARDLAAAELSLVPAGDARDVGIDRGLLAGYGHDDRACAYAAVRALLSARRPARTAIVLLVDKVETGSVGQTSARSAFLRRLYAELIERTGQSSTEARVSAALAASVAAVGDAQAAAHPAYAAYYADRGAPVMGAGVILGDGTRAATGHDVRAALRAGRIPVQAAQPSDLAAAVGLLGIPAIRLAVPVLSQSAPTELMSKADLYALYRAYALFFARR